MFVSRRIYAERSVSEEKAQFERLGGIVRKSECVVGRAFTVACLAAFSAVCVRPGLAQQTNKTVVKIPKLPAKLPVKPPPKVMPPPKPPVTNSQVTHLPPRIEHPPYTPYQSRHHDFERRTYYVNGKAYERYYRGYRYRGVVLREYAPVRYYPVAYYGWVYHPWVTPVPFVWGWAGSAWYAYYGPYFVPYAVYPNASLWLTDYLIANTLQARYEALANPVNGGALPPMAGTFAPLTPDVKQMISNEVQGQIQLESYEAQTVAQGEDPAAEWSGIERLLQDNAAHVFVAGSGLTVVASAGGQCGLGPGDVVQVSPPYGSPDSPVVNATVLASGPQDCTRGATVSLQVADLQEMQNHMREAADDGLSEMRTRAGQAGGLPALPVVAQGDPATPPFSAATPPDAPSAPQQQPNLPGPVGQAADVLTNTAAQIDKVKAAVGTIWGTVRTAPVAAATPTNAAPLMDGAHSGTLECSGGPFAQNAEYVFGDLPPGPLKLFYEDQYWEAKFVPGEGQRQRLIMRNKGPGARKSCVVHWVAEN